MADASATVTIFLPSLEGGGAEKSIVTIANGLATRRIQVQLVVASARGVHRNHVSPDVRVVDLGVASVPRALPALTRHLRESRPAAVLSAMSHANVVATLAHRLSGSTARLVLSEHSLLSSSLAEYRGLRMRVVRALMPWCYARADRIITVSRSVADDLMRHIPLAPERIVTIHNPVVGDRFVEKAAEPPAHAWLRDRSIPVVLGVGRLIPLKDFATLIDAFATLRRTRPLRLVILGEGESRAALADHARRLGVSQDVALPGFEPNPFPAMRAAGVFVQSSRYEGLGNALIEAMACGTPVVSTDCPGGPREILEDGRWGALVPVGDAHAMAAAICAALDNPRPRDARQRASAFTEERAIKRYADALGMAATG